MFFFISEKNRLNKKEKYDRHGDMNRSSDIKQKCVPLSLTQLCKICGLNPRHHRRKKKKKV